jgi:hypothetical protein
LDLSGRVNSSGNKCDEHATPEYLAPVHAANPWRAQVAFTGNVSATKIPRNDQRMRID